MLLEFEVSAARDFGMPARERFYVELKPGKTSIVSWKMLLKEYRKSACPCPSSQAPIGAHPALEARLAPEVAKEKEFFHPLRLSSVYERIERLYQGDNSSDELNGGVEDDKYDTQDSFIDDADLDNYFSMDNVKLKHSGFFVHRGKLEQEVEILPPSIAGTKRSQIKNMRKVKKLSTGLHHAPKDFNSENSGKAYVEPPCLSATSSSSPGIGNVGKMEEHKNYSAAEKSRKGSLVNLSKKNPADGHLDNVLRCKVDGCISKINSKEGINKLSHQNTFSRRDALTHRQPSTRDKLNAAATRKAIRRLAIAKNTCPLQGSQSPSSSSENPRKNGGFKWDHIIEDRVCDLCEECIKGEDENKGFHLRKLYLELIELWPQGCMDIMGIKLAVHRAKERRKLSQKIKKTADASKRQLLTMKRKLENPDDDGIPISQLFAKKSSLLGEKLRRLDTSNIQNKQER